ncbi:MAG: hypothetical protein Kow0090_12060 [Myxococcota bacterium]
MWGKKEINQELLIRLTQLSRNQESGQLVFKNEEVKGFVVFYEGKIAWAVSNRQRETLGELMLKTGRISPVHFEMASAIYREYNGRKKFGQIILEIADFDKESLKACLRDHTRSALETLLVNRSIAVEFKPCFIVDDDDITFDITEIFSAEETLSTDDKKSYLM